MRYCVLVLICLLVASCVYNNEETLYPEFPEECGADTATYSGFVAPLLEEHCTGCHGGRLPSANVGLDTYDKVRAAANSGRLYGTIAHLPNWPNMPRGGSQLPECDIALVKGWIDAGAQDN